MHQASLGLRMTDADATGNVIVAAGCDGPDARCVWRADLPATMCAPRARRVD